MLFVAAGMAVDFMRHEAHRTELQDAIDRGVLAAASLTQTLEPEAAIRGYLKSTSIVSEDVVLSVSELTAFTARQVTAEASYDMRTYFLKMIGLPSLKVVARGQALESKADVEVSLVLDVSTDLALNTANGTSRTRLDTMQDAAKSFVSYMFDPARTGTATISLIPFAGQVNPGAAAANFLIGTPTHPYSNCIDFASGDYLATALPPAGTAMQDQYFTYSPIYLGYKSPITPGPDNSGAWGNNVNALPLAVEMGWCPVADSNDITYFSTDEVALHEEIRTLRAHDGSAPQYGMKWASALLDASNNALIANLVTTGDVAPVHVNRPMVNDGSVLKVIVLMSDGLVTDQPRVDAHDYDEPAERDWWANNVLDTADPNSPYGRQDFDVIFDEAQARAQFLDACTAAKTNGVIVFAIGFDVAPGTQSETDLIACASSQSHYYDASGLQIDTAFGQIGDTIRKLQLVN